MARTIAVFIEVSDSLFDDIVTYDAEELGSGFSFSDGHMVGEVKLDVVSVIDSTGKPIDRTW